MGGGDGGLGLGVTGAESRGHASHRTRDPLHYYARTHGSPLYEASPGMTRGREDCGMAN